MAPFTPLEYALLLDSGAVKAGDGRQFAVCPACVAPEAAAIIKAHLKAASSSQPEEFNVENVAVLANPIIGPVLLMRHMPLTDLEQLLLTEVKALRPVTDADTQRIRECPSSDGRTGDDLAAQYETVLDLMALDFNKAYDFLYWELYAPCLGWDCEGAAGALRWLDPARGSGASGAAGGGAGGAAGGAAAAAGKGL